MQTQSSSELLEMFCDNICLNIGYNEVPDESHFQMQVDDSDFVVVDGEEGDHGVIRYLDSEGSLMATRTVHGGDSEEIEFTEHGKRIFSTYAVDIIRSRIWKD